MVNLLRASSTAVISSHTAIFQRITITIITTTPTTTARPWTAQWAVRRAVRVEPEARAAKHGPMLPIIDTTDCNTGGPATCKAMDTQ